MKRTPPAPDPDAHVTTPDGWRSALVEALRTGVREAAALEEVVTWGACGALLT